MSLAKASSRNSAEVWPLLEETVERWSRRRLAGIRTADLKPYLATLKQGNDALWKLGAGRMIDYDAPGVADAYALKFHLPRADNLTVALNHPTLRRSLPDVREVLDLGGGTGSLAYALAAHGASSEGRFPRRITAVERSESMSSVGGELFETLRHSLQESFSRPSLTIETSTSPPDRIYDLVVASHFFAVPTDEADAQRQIAALIGAARFLRPGGWMLMLTPNVEEKLRLRDRFAARTGNLARRLHDETSVSGGEIRIAKEKHPNGLVALRREIDAASRRLLGQDTFGEPAYDDPYYGFYAHLDLWQSRA